jgi:hypothetical protein
MTVVRQERPVLPEAIRLGPLSAEAVRKLSEILQKTAQSKIFRDFFASGGSESSKKRTKRIRLKTCWSFPTACALSGHHRNSRLGFDPSGATHVWIFELWPATILKITGWHGEGFKVIKLFEREFVWR